MSDNSKIEEKINKAEKALIQVVKTLEDQNASEDIATKCFQFLQISLNIARDKSLLTAQSQPVLGSGFSLDKSYTDETANQSKINSWQTAKAEAPKTRSVKPKIEDDDDEITFLDD